MDVDAQNMPKVELVFHDFKGRRIGLIKALTTDVQRLHQECDRVLGTEEENGLCLFGLPDGTWEAKKPAEYVPTELPEYPAPAVGINHALGEQGGLTKFAELCDVWLISMAFSQAVKTGIDKGGRQRLFSLISDVPTLLELFNKAEDNQTGSEPQEAVQAKDSGKRVLEEEDKEDPVQAKDSGKRVLEEEDEEKNSICWQCKQKQYPFNDAAASDQDFWIACDECEKWYHGKCVYITEKESKHFKYYKCPNCSKKRSRRLSQQRQS